jgi:hypothetical protein
MQLLGIAEEGYRPTHMLYLSRQVDPLASDSCLIEVCDLDGEGDRN